ncbi:monovalent cation/H+ antiporter complex subunit F [Actinomadura opuntiae]|uniref:monovalent cation/H+ antiporter complex subunit F n=1 Tax=Actinomadura sp. OS1-43 TaxID=604315 RepID=UPI00255AD9D7|nr:monovalent cation/H+ antiporter complex subunit F [Actinomadura sp. OS1-43]MDL4812635.1 monovalent cation/H+ antiporter complex subunit F [Actinomadura sp. OS1-43]
MSIAVPALVILVAAVLPALLTTLRGRPVDRLAGLIVTGPLVTLVLALLASAYGRTSYLDVALILALLSFAGSLVFARFFSRTL